VPSKKERLDQLMLKLGLAESRSKAQALIMEGKVFVNEEKICKSGTKINIGASIRVMDPGAQWVSRGAHKLVKALTVFSVDPVGSVCMDVGASTGGFTEVLLAAGASKVYSVDVGYGQLAWKLRQDQRVVVLERENARYLKPDDFKEKMDLITIDVSFISLKLLLPPLTGLLSPEGHIIALLKPQFEAGRNRLGKNGVVKDPDIHKDIIRGIIDFIEGKTELSLEAVDFSPITGPKGNIEFLLLLSRSTQNTQTSCRGRFEDIVDMAHRNFKKRSE